MKTQTMVGVAVLAAGVAVAMAAANGGSGVKLPLPQVVSGAHRTTAGSAAAGSSVGPTDTNPPSGADPRPSVGGGGSDQQTIVYSTSPPAALTGCTVSVSNPAPLRGETAETVTVSSTTGAEVRLEADYVRTRSVHSGIVDGSGTATFSLAIAHAEPGFTVRVTATVSLRGTKDSCSTSFTPVYPAGTVVSTGGGL